MSGCQFQLESEGFLSVRLMFTHPTNGSVSLYDQDFNPFTRIIKLKEDMANKLGVSKELQEWKFKGQVLDDNQSLDDAEVDCDDVIEVTEIQVPE